MRFRGSVRLVTLHLWRIAKSTDLEACFGQARELGYFSQENEDFVRKCLAANQLLEDGQMPDWPITGDTVRELQQCAIRLNSADPA